jgi:hypothetical protein
MAWYLITRKDNLQNTAILLRCLCYRLLRYIHLCPKRVLHNLNKSIKYVAPRKMTTAAVFLTCTGDVPDSTLSHNTD